MAEVPIHPTDALEDALDARLAPDRQAALEAHLATCEACRREFGALQWTKTVVARTVRSADAQLDFTADLQRMLDDEDRSQSGERRDVVASRGIRLALPYWGVAAAALVVVMWVAYRSFAPAAPVQAAADFRAFTSGASAAALQTTDPSTLESRLNASDPPFAVRVFDFGTMSYALTGGAVHRFLGRPSVLITYRNADGHSLLCQMYVGRVEDLPEPIERRRQSDVDFLVYRERELTVVFWQDGDVLCVLVADADPEAVIRLAFARVAES